MELSDSGLRFALTVAGLPSGGEKMLSEIMDILTREEEDE